MEGVVELALCSSSHKDPQNLGLHFYKSGQPPDDVLGQKAFMERCGHRNNTRGMHVHTATVPHFYYVLCMRLST